jgi:hypothetical protein
MNPKKGMKEERTKGAQRINSNVINLRPTL